MISYADLRSDDVVLEIGAGLGFLTRSLSSKCKKVIAVEVDRRLISVLRERLSDIDNIELIEGNVLTADIPPFAKVVSTPPYSISSPLLFWLLAKPFKVAVMVFQEDFARRLKAHVGSKDYSRLTVAMYYRAEAELLDQILRSDFYPLPDVDSTIVRLRPRPPPFHVSNESVFFDFTRVVFTQRNKKLRKAVLAFLLAQGLKKEIAHRIADTLTFHDRRVRELAPEDFGALTNEILDKVRVLQ